jgi:hypothetical protein
MEQLCPVWSTPPPLVSAQHLSAASRMLECPLNGTFVPVESLTDGQGWGWELRRGSGRWVLFRAPHLLFLIPGSRASYFTLMELN